MMRARRTDIPGSEAEIQAAVVAWCDRVAALRWPDLARELGHFPIFHVPAGELRPVDYAVDRRGEVKRYSPVGRKLQRLGTRPGVPDLILPVPAEEYVGLAIEMKTRAGRATSAQRSWLDFLAKHGWRAVLCRSVDEAVGEIEGYLLQREEARKNGCTESV